MIYLFFTLFFIALQGFFALFEMAALSMNSLRLRYSAGQGKKRSLWLSSLMQRPSRFFGMTLVGVNASLQIGSECSRKFYEAMHLDPDFAFITQAILVIIFGELTPMFMARRYPSQIAIAFVPSMVLFSRLFLPVIWVLDLFSRLIQRCMGTLKGGRTFFSREEIAVAFREGHEDQTSIITEQIFQLKNKRVEQVMIPLGNLTVVSMGATVEQARKSLTHHFESVIPIYQHQTQNIVAIAKVRDLLRLDGKQKISEVAVAPWFVPSEVSILEVLNQFRHNNQTASIILDHTGAACGVLTMDQIEAQIFGRAETYSALMDEPSKIVVERTLLGSLSVAEFNREFQAEFHCEGEETLSDYFIEKLDHFPDVGEMIREGPFLFVVTEIQMRGIKKLSVRSVKD